MDIVITCPSCSRKSRTDAGKIPTGKLKMTCRSCSNQFILDKVSQLNCKHVRAYPKEGWQVEIPACKGMTYDLDAIAGLIRSGMVTPETQLCPPKTRQTLKAALIPDLERAFELFAQRNREGRGGLDATR